MNTHAYKIAPISGNIASPSDTDISRFMTPIPLSPQPSRKIRPEECKHPQVQIVSRNEDTEYVECKECGDVFESSELRDMAIEEKKGGEEE